MDIKTKPIRKTDYITDTIENINSNTSLFKEKIEEIYDELGLDSDTGSIEVDRVSSSAVHVKNGGNILIYSKENDNVAGLISVDPETNKSIAEFDKIKVGTIEIDSTVVSKSNVMQQSVVQSYYDKSFSTKIADQTIEFDSKGTGFTFLDEVNVPELKINDVPSECFTSAEKQKLASIFVNIDVQHYRLYAGLPATAHDKDLSIVDSETRLRCQIYSKVLTPKGTYRLPTSAEYVYMLGTRTGAIDKRFRATLTDAGDTGIKGLMILPDVFDMSLILPFTEDSYGKLMTIAEFKELEALGAAFLPCAGGIHAAEGHNPALYVLQGFNTNGWYWTSSRVSNWTRALKNHSSGIGGDDFWHSYFPLSVRLVQDCDSSTLGAIQVDANSYVKFTSGNLQYEINTEKWYIAKGQWEMLGEANITNVRSGQGRVDLMQYGSSGYEGVIPITGSTVNIDITGTEYDHGIHNDIYEYKLIEGDRIYRPGSVFEFSSVLNAWVPISGYTVDAIEELPDKIDLIISKVATAPTYVAPVASINQSNVNVETGTTWSQDKTASFTQNDAGDLTSAVFDSVDFSEQELSNKSKTLTIAKTNVTTVQTITASFTYAQGPLKNNNFDIPDNRGRIAAGTKTQSFTITPELHYFYGAVNDAWTITSANVRTDTTNTAPSSTLMLETGTTYKRFVVAVPSTVSITSVTDEGNLHADITSNYVLQGTFQIEDAGQNLHDYKVYMFEPATSYPTSTTHKITIA